MDINVQIKMHLVLFCVCILSSKIRVHLFLLNDFFCITNSNGQVISESSFSHVGKMGKVIEK